MTLEGIQTLLRTRYDTISRDGDILDVFLEDMLPSDSMRYMEETGVYLIKDSAKYLDVYESDDNNLFRNNY